MTGWINQIVAPSFDWVTFLTLNDVHLSRTDLIQVSRLTNLGVLMVGRIHGEDLDLDDNIVRAWSRAASEAGAFARLRILVCRTQHLITGQVFTHFEHFPQLALLFVDDHHCTSAFKHRAWEHHWRKMKELPRRLLSSEAGTSKHRTWYNVYGWCFSDGVFDSKVLDDQHKCAREGPPVLDLVSGPADCHWLRGSTVVADMTMFARKSRSMGNKQIHQKSQENDWPIILPGAANRRLENV